MKRIAILGGGISGLTAAYELELARKRGVAIDWHLYEASDRLGGIIETTRIPSPAGEYILEGGPDGWVSEKPWARELAVELGLESELIYSEDATRKTYVERDGQLLPIPDRMRFMVPEDLAVLEGSPLFSDSACAAYALELANASQLKASALPEGQDESVASFVRRHFGEEVVHTLAAPLLAGVFGGDVDKLSVRAVMPQMVALEREHGSLIAGLAAKSKARAGKPPVAIFTSLRRGMASLVEALVSALPAHRVHRNHRASKLAARDGWRIYFEGHRADPSIPIATIMPPATPDNDPSHRCEHLILATDLGTTRRLGSDLHPAIGSLFPQRETDVSLLPRYSSSAMLAAFTWPAELASAFTIPQGFGFVVPPHRQRSEVSAFRSDSQPLSLLAATFVDQKFPHRTPHGARIIRAFFGGDSANRLSHATDEQVATAALTQLQKLLGPIPPPEHTVVRRWPHSLPQYEPGHLDRIAALEQLLAEAPGLHLLGNSLHGVGVPDLIRDARATARRILAAF